MDSEMTLEKKYLRAQRFKTIKDLEKEYSKELISIYREKTEQKKHEEEFKSVAEAYKKKIEEIEFLKNKKEEIFENVRKNQIEKDKSNLMLQEYLTEVERKKNDFDQFMKNRGKEALTYFKRNEELKKKLEEELHKYEDKKKAKENGKNVAKYQVDNYREKKEKEQKEIENSKLPQQNVLYKINQTFHNLGNKIDYSTTRFHNIIVVKHEDELKEFNIENHKSAHEKAEKETEKLKTRKKSKEVAEICFENKTKLNNKEIIRRENAKENLNRLQEELSKINDARKKSRSKNKMLPVENMKTRAKNMEKKSHNMMNRILEQKMNKRREIFNNLTKQENDQEIKIKEESISQPDDMSEFYKDNSFMNGEENNLDRDDYLNQAILEHNENVQEKLKTVSGSLGLNKKIHYEEPISREPNYTEHIKRLNPVDLESYNLCKNDIKGVKIVHKNNYNHNFNQNFTNNVYNEKKEITEININDLLRPNKDSYLSGNNNIDTNIKQKASSMVMEFLNDINKTPVYDNKKEKEKEKEKSYLYAEPKFNLKDKESDSRDATKEIKKNTKEMSTKSKKEMTKPNIIVNKDNTSKICTPIDKPEEEEKIDDEFVRDKSKWKYSKEELLERRKKMLKDKKIVNKAKK